MNRICVYCGSSSGGDPVYLRAARRAADALLDRELGLVYGGASVGVMGVLADRFLEGGGEVIGVIPRALVDREVAHDGLSDLRVVDTMHQRKATMADLADGFIALPGGLGTLEETLEVITWSQLGVHAKLCGLLNVGGYFDHLAAFLDHAVEQRFVRPVHRRLVLMEADPETLLERFEGWVPPALNQWIDRDSL